MRFSDAMAAVFLAIGVLPAAAEWQIVEDDFLYMRQDGSGGSVMVYCSKPGHRLFPAVIAWPKPLSAPARGAGTGVIKLRLPGAKEAKSVWATVYGNVTSVKLDRETDEFLEDLRLVAGRGGSVLLKARAEDGTDMTLEVDLKGYPQTAEKFQQKCSEESERMLRAFDRAGRRRR